MKCPACERDTNLPGLCASCRKLLQDAEQRGKKTRQAIQQNGPRQKAIHSRLLELFFRPSERGKHGHRNNQR